MKYSDIKTGQSYFRQVSVRGKTDKTQKLVRRVVSFDCYCPTGRTKVRYIKGEDTSWEYVTTAKSFVEWAEGKYDNIRLSRMNLNPWSVFGTRCETYAEAIKLLKQKSGPQVAYHFTKTDGSLRKPCKTDKGEIVTHISKGQTLVCNSTSICSYGLHASKRIMDALRYAPGLLLSKVICEKTEEEHSDKLVCRKRTVVWSIDITEILSNFLDIDKSPEHDVLFASKTSKELTEEKIKSLIAEQLLFNLE